MGDQSVDPTTQASLQNAAVNAGLSDQPGVPLTSGDLEEQPAEAAAEDTSGQPPRGGEGSGRDAWAEYAAAQGVEVTDDMNRDDIIEAVDAK